MMNDIRLIGMSAANGGTGVVGVQHPPVVDVEDFEPKPRDRCNTWPLQKPAGDLGHNTSPLIHEEIPEEEDGDEDEECSLEDISGDNSRHQQEPSTRLVNNNNNHSQQANGVVGGGRLLRAASPTGRGGTTNGPQCLGGKKNSSRRNAWGNLSYADLITQAILGSPDKRLTLSQIYDWMVHNVPYFRDKGDSNSSAGWKNSIRHNLSLHSRFMRVQNEGAGKSSWWMINPDAKHGKCSRRRTASMEQSKLWEKKRGRLKKSDDYHPVSMEHLALSADDHSDASSLYSSTNELNGLTSQQFTDEFRCRVGSTLSNFSVGSRGSTRLSPTLDDSWADLSVNVHQSNGVAEGHSPYNSLVETLPQSMKLEIDQLPPQQQSQQVSPYRTPKLEYSPTQSSCANSCTQQSTLNTQQQRRVKVEPINYDDVVLQPAENGNTPSIFGSEGLEKLYYQHSPQSNNHNNLHQQQQQQHVFYRNNHLNNHINNHHFNNHHHNNHFVADDRAFYYYGTASINEQQLPSELNEFNYFKPDSQWDVDQVIRHELTLTGKLDFNDLTQI